MIVTDSKDFSPWGRIVFWGVEGVGGWGGRVGYLGRGLPGEGVPGEGIPEEDAFSNSCMCFVFSPGVHVYPPGSSRFSVLFTSSPLKHIQLYDFN